MDTIQLLDGRKTDILTLQEDKISYVLAGKNLLRDATGGGAVTSVPEVLGTQIARLEDYGISENPESYASYGPNKYFTDAKRGAVINLIGGAYNNEQLQVISEAGMRSWFRDLFIETFNTQKLGGFDPYMNEYVLHSNVQLPMVSEDCIPCDTSKNITVLPNQSFTYCVDVGNLLEPRKVNLENVQLKHKSALNGFFQYAMRFLNNNLSPLYFFYFNCFLIYFKYDFSIKRIVGYHSNE